VIVRSASISLDIFNIWETIELTYSLALGTIFSALKNLAINIASGARNLLSHQNRPFGLLKSSHLDYLIFGITLDLRDGTLTF